VKRAARNREQLCDLGGGHFHHPRHCERSEAIQAVTAQ